MDVTHFPLKIIFSNDSNEKIEKFKALLEAMKVQWGFSVSYHIDNNKGNTAFYIKIFPDHGYYVLGIQTAQQKILQNE